MDEAAQLYTALVKEEEKLGLCSPAQKAFDRARFEYLMKRKDPAWMQVHGKEYAAKMLYAQQFIEAGVPEKYQQEAFDPKHYQENLRKFCQRKPMKTLLEANTVPELAEEAIGKGRMYTKALDICKDRTKDAYLKASLKERTQTAKDEMADDVAFEIAAEEAQINHKMSLYHKDNPDLQKRMQKIKADPSFKETIDFMTRGKSPKQIYDLDYSGRTIVDEGIYVQGYKELKLCREYAKICAEKYVRRSLAEQVPDAMGNEDVGNVVDVLMKNKKFLAEINNNTAGKTVEELEPVLNSIKNDPEAQKQMMDTLSKKISVSISRKPEVVGNRPNVLEAGSQLQI